MYSHRKKIIDLAKHMVADAPVKKKSKNLVPNPSVLKPPMDERVNRLQKKKGAEFFSVRTRQHFSSFD